MSKFITQGFENTALKLREVIQIHDLYEYFLRCRQKTGCTWKEFKQEYLITNKNKQKWQTQRQPTKKRLQKN